MQSYSDTLDLVLFYSYLSFHKNKVLYYLDIIVNRDYIGVIITAIVYRTISGKNWDNFWLWYITPERIMSLCHEPELIPDPLGCRSSDERNNANLMDLGSGVGL